MHRIEFLTLRHFKQKTLAILEGLISYRLNWSPTSNSSFQTGVLPVLTKKCVVTGKKAYAQDLAPQVSEQAAIPRDTLSF